MPVDLRENLGRMVFARIAGADGPGDRERIHHAPGERWFAADRPIRTVHADTSMFIGGLRALLLQSLHPLAMAGVAGHSDYRSDPWGRLQRTSYFLAVTTFGTAADAERAVARVRGIHRRVNGVAADGRPYAADDPRLLQWVHVAEIDSFLRAHQRYGANPLDRDGRNAYVADTARIAAALGVIDPPTTTRELREQLATFRPELASTPQARAAARYLLVRPPLPTVFRGPYVALGAAAIGLLPPWARLPLRLPYLPLTEATVVRAAGTVLTGGLRWVMPGPPSGSASAGADVAPDRTA